MSRPRIAVRTERGALHIAVQAGRRFETACYRTITARSAVVYEGRDRLGRRRADVAWRHERQCQDCLALLQRGVSELVRVAGW